MKVIQYIKINHLFNRVAFASGVILALLAIAIHLPIISNGEQEAQAATGTAQESSLTLAVERDTAALDLNVASSNGTFATSSSADKASFSVTTNNYTGYTLSISASDDAGTLANGNDSLTSITTNKTLTDTTFDNSNYNGMWGYKPSKYMNGNTVVDNTGTNAVYLISPTTTATTLHVTSAANSTANSYDIALGARADYTKPSGIYSKTFILTAVANKINYSVTYNKNTTDTVTNMPYSNTGNVQSGDTNSTSITLSDLVPVRDGYNFKGWCSVATSDETCSGTTYNPDGAGTDLTYGIDQTTINVGTLYAMWEEDIIHLQGLNYTECLGDDKVAIDSRDQNDYTISTLGDGACWMTQNLRLGSNGEMITLTNSDSDVTSSFSFTSAPAWSGVFTSANVDTAQAYYSGDTSLGSYYNWYTATASTGNSSTAADIEAHSSICPKGWVLPNRAEYAMLLGQYGNDENKLWSPALPNYVITGYYKDTLHNQSTTHTYAWERTAKSASSGDDMFLRIGKATATDGMNKYYGMPVRCRLGGDKTSFTVIYNANGGTGTMSSQTTNTGSITLSSNSFTRPNYAFLGWSNDSSDTNPKFYAGSTIVSYTDTLNVYAVWRQVYSITFNKDSNVSSIEVLDSDGNIVGTITSSEQSLTLYKGDTYTIKPTYATRYAPNVFEKTSGVGTFTKQTGYIGTFTVGAGTATINVTSQYVDTPMQNYSCSNIANVGNTKYIYDTRDNEVYLVGKLADNKCWMLDNLRFDIVAHKDDISSSNTNITNSATLTSLKSGNRSAGNNYATAGVSYWGTNSYSAPQIAIQGKNEDDNEWDSNTTATSYGNGSGKIGVYYNYCAASAGSYCYSKNAAPEDDTSASQDICPAGWRMPTSGNSGEYAALLTAYNNNETATDTGSLQYNLSTPLSGHFYYGSAYLQDLYGRFWSSTRHDGSYMYYLYVSSSYVNPQYGYSGDRDYGFPVRCLLQ